MRVRMCIGEFCESVCYVVCIFGFVRVNHGCLYGCLCVCIRVCMYRCMWIDMRVVHMSVFVDALTYNTHIYT